MTAPAPLAPRPAAVDPARCPLCGGPNACAVQQGLPVQDCWCWHTGPSAQALARLPVAEQGQRCICAACGAPAPAPSHR